MTRRVEFDAAVRRGRRAGRPRLVAHAYLPAERDGEHPRVGFVVSRAVGGAVVRNRVARRLRHVVRERLGLLPDGLLLVVRALPPAATATSAELATDLDAALRRLRLVAPVPSAVSSGRQSAVPSAVPCAVPSAVPLDPSGPGRVR